MSCVEDLDLYEYDEGVDIVLTLIDRATKRPIDISAATGIQYEFVPPNPGRPIIVSASLKDGGTTGKMKYTIGAGVLTPPGRWKVQAYISTPTRRFHTSVAVFLVKSNLLASYDRILSDAAVAADEIVVS